MARYDVSPARVIPVGHGHYDHLMDVPRVAALTGHWENCLHPVSELTEAIGMSDIMYFEQRLDRTFDGETWRPEIGTVFRFPRATTR